MNRQRTGSRVLIYSHDSFGLGHLRRCRTIAHSLVGRFGGLSALILSGSPIIGSFDFRSRVDFIRIPGVIKLRNGEYTSLSLDIGLEQTLMIRAEIIRHTADIFAPDILIVDKEPLGLRGEVQDTLTALKQRGTRLVLGLRDVMDEPRSLAPEWERKNVMPALQDLYDEIWVYGLPQICDPLEGIEVPDEVRRKMRYTGYLRRSVPPPRPTHKMPEIVQQPYILVTTGGGGDGDGLIEWVLRAYETEGHGLHPALLVLGPFMQPERQADFMARTERLPMVETITFDAHMEELEANALGVVAMGGYNTFCEVLSLDKRAVFVPRTQPRLEQYIRASRAQALGLARMLEQDGHCDPAVMANALRELPHQGLPSEAVVPGLLDGLDKVHGLVKPWLPAARPASKTAAAGAVRIGAASRTQAY